MTIGNLDAEDKMEQAYESVKDMNIRFTTMVEKVSVEMIVNDGESNIIIEKKLHKSISFLHK